MSEKSRTQCGKLVSENSRIQLEFRDGAAVMMTWQHYLYDGSGQLMVIRYKGADYYYIRDGLMTITGLVDANGAAVVNYRLFFVKHFSLKKASEFPVFSEGFSLL